MTRETCAIICVSPEWCACTLCKFSQTHCHCVFLRKTARAVSGAQQCRAFQKSTSTVYPFVFSARIGTLRMWAKIDGLNDAPIIRLITIIIIKANVWIVKLLNKRYSPNIKEHRFYQTLKKLSFVAMPSYLCFHASCGDEFFAGLCHVLHTYVPLTRELFQSIS